MVGKPEAEIGDLRDLVSRIIKLGESEECSGEIASRAVGGLFEKLAA